MEPFSVKYDKNQLNVEYVPKFIMKSQADDYFEQLKSLPFYTPTYRLWGKTNKLKRQVLAYGDPDTTYSFSGTQVHGQSWTPLMLELRGLVEDFAGCSFNYVLLNLFPDGNNCIIQHRDENGLDSTFPIIVLSFGETRTIEFQRFHYPSTTIHLQHGSLYSMMKPTNELFTHGIAPDASVKKPRISLTFRHLIKNSDTFCPSVKRPRLCIDQKCSFSQSSKVVDVDKNSMTTKPPTQLPCESEKGPLDLNDWLTKHIQASNPPNPIVERWSLEWNTYVFIMLGENNTLRLHIRNFKESNSGVQYPTKQGIIMTCATFCDFESKLRNFKFSSESDSFICNNQLLVAYQNSDYCILQQIFSSFQSNDFTFKPVGFRLSKDQILKLIDHLFNIGECLIEVLFTKLLHRLILKKTEVCSNHISVEKAKSSFLTCIENEVKTCINRFHKCISCENSYSSLFSHPCTAKTFKEKFHLDRQKILLNANPYEIVKNVHSNGCMCHITPDFLSQFDITTIESYLETVFENKHY